jgi:arylsulfatase
MGPLTGWSILNTKNKSYSVTAEVDVRDSGADGVIVALGGVIGGWSLYAKKGKPKYCYNFSRLEQTYVDGQREIPAGTHQVRIEFAYDGGGIAKGGT